MHTLKRPQNYFLRNYTATTVTKKALKHTFTEKCLGNIPSERKVTMVALSAATFSYKAGGQRSSGYHHPLFMTLRTRFHTIKYLNVIKESRGYYNRLYKSIFWAFSYLVSSPPSSFHDLDRLHSWPFSSPPSGHKMIIKNVLRHCFSSHYAQTAIPYTCAGMFICFCSFYYLLVRYTPRIDILAARLRKSICTAFFLEQACKRPRTGTQISF